MHKTPSRGPIDRYTLIGDLANSVRWLLSETIWPLSFLLAIGTGCLAFTGSPGAMAFALISIGTIVVFAKWRKGGIGLPVVPVLGLQHLIAYGLPILIGHDDVRAFPPSYITSAGTEVLIFLCSLALAWGFGMKIFTPSSTLSYAIQGLTGKSSNKLRRFGYTLIVISSVYTVLQSMNRLSFFLQLLPSGSTSLLVALMGAAAACGFFVIAMFIGGGQVSGPGRVLFWVLVLLNCYINAAGYLLSPATVILVAVLIGLFWSRGRVPWTYLLIVLFVLSYLNIGKYTMRDRYWNKDIDNPMPQLSFQQMPASYAEWIQASYDDILGKNERTGGIAGEKAHEKGQSLLERVNNLQNILYVMDATDRWNIPSLGGKTYALIPPLLVPRIFWRDKPRAHEGQVMLNVHYGRQAIESTFQTYIAWGLLPEAYGNFGPKWGAILLGLVLGVFFAWLENATARKPLLSLEGLIAFTILLGMANSYEMVASILVTSIFQSIIPLIIGSAPFIRRMHVVRPAAPA